MYMESSNLFPLLIVVKMVFTNVWYQKFKFNDVHPLFLSTNQ